MAYIIVINWIKTPAKRLFSLLSSQRSPASGGVNYVIQNLLSHLIDTEFDSKYAEFATIFVFSGFHWTLTGVWICWRPTSAPVCETTQENWVRSCDRSTESKISSEVTVDNFGFDPTLKVYIISIIHLSPNVLYD